MLCNVQDFPQEEGMNELNNKQGNIPLCRINTPSKEFVTQMQKYKVPHGNDPCGFVAK